MSSFKNAMKIQQVHRERHQKKARAHLGPLEKKKDYKIRAEDQNKKKILLKELHKKALERNPDEFHFHMYNSQVVNRIHKERPEERNLTIPDVKTDLTYVKFRRTMEQKRIDKLKKGLHFLETNVEDDEEELQNKHVLFVDTLEEERTLDPSTLMDTHPSLMGRRFNRLRNNQLQNLPDTLQLDLDAIKTASAEKSKSYKELCRRTERDGKLKLLQHQLEVNLHFKKHHESNEKRLVKLPGPKCITRATDTSTAVFKWPSIRKK